MPLRFGILVCMALFADACTTEVSAVSGNAKGPVSAAPLPPGKVGVREATEMAILVKQISEAPRHPGHSSPMASISNKENWSKLMYATMLPRSSTPWAEEALRRVRTGGPPDPRVSQAAVQECRRSVDFGNSDSTEKEIAAACMPLRTSLFTAEERASLDACDFLWDLLYGGGEGAPWGDGHTTQIWTPAVSSFVQERIDACPLADGEIAAAGPVDTISEATARWVDSRFAAGLALDEIAQFGPNIQALVGPWESARQTWRKQRALVRPVPLIIPVDLPQATGTLGIPVEKLKWNASAHYGPSSPFPDELGKWVRPYTVAVDSNGKITDGYRGPVGSVNDAQGVVNGPLLEQMTLYIDTLKKVAGHKGEPVDIEHSFVILTIHPNTSSQAFSRIVQSAHQAGFPRLLLAVNDPSPHLWLPDNAVLSLPPDGLDPQALFTQLAAAPDATIQEALNHLGKDHSTGPAATKGPTSRVNGGWEVDTGAYLSVIPITREGLLAYRSSQVPRKTSATQVVIEQFAGSTPGIHAVLERKKRQVLFCYEQSLKLDPGLGGRLEIEVNIVDGRVTAARVVQNVSGDSSAATAAAVAQTAMKTCVLVKVRRWRFPQETTTTGAIRIPFTLSVIPIQLPADVPDLPDGNIQNLEDALKGVSPWQQP